MKYDAVVVEEVGDDKRRSARAGLGLAPDSLVLVGGSTHPGEEMALLAAAAELRRQHPGLRVVVAPRHINRGTALERDIRAAGWRVRRRSVLGRAQALMGEAQAADQVLLVDTLGELGDVYRAADVAFVGGSLIPHGGQNMMEPAGLGLPVLLGPHTANFSETVAMLEAAGGCLVVAGVPDMKEALGALLADPGRRLQMGRAGREVINGARGATGRNVALLRELFERSGGTEGGLSR
jgi:3-deoxy-D-manno-octulosonic-acid transferase